MKPIRVLITDDSALFREILSEKLSADPDIVVVAKAANPFEARDMIVKYRPDVMTLDVQMPRMNGIDFVKKLMPQYPMPIIMVSSLTNTVFDALAAGAVDFVNKPTYNTGINVFINELIVKIKLAMTSTTSHLSMTTDKELARKRIKQRAKIGLIAVGASTGGTIAVAKLLHDFTLDMPGTIIVQHMPAHFTKMYADRLNGECSVNVKEAEDGDMVTTGNVLIAAGDTHIRVVRRGTRYYIKTEKCTACNKVNGHCPSVDVLFKSVATEVGNQAIGVILTGMGKDGAMGLNKMKLQGAITFAQDEDSSVVYGMPKVAFELGAVDYQLPIAKISGKIISILEKSE